MSPILIKSRYLALLFAVFVAELCFKDSAEDSILVVIIFYLGPQKCLGAAQYLINQRVAEEELKRQHNAAGQHINIGF